MGSFPSHIFDPHKSEGGPMMSRYRGLLTILALAVAALPAMGRDPAIRGFWAVYVKAFKKHDGEGVASMGCENGTHVDRQTGVRTEGRAKIRAALAELFKKPAKPHLAGTIDRIHMIK